MKALFRLMIVAGLMLVLTPCECEQIAGAQASSCPSSSNDCCGGETSLFSNSDMGQKAFLSDGVHVPPPVVSARTGLVCPVFSVTAFHPSAARIDTGPPPSFNRPLLI